MGARVAAGEVDFALAPPSGSVCWVEGMARAPVLRLAPIDVAEALRDTLWSKTTSILTSGGALTDLGCVLGQGFGLFRPMPAEALTRLLSSGATIPAPRNASAAASTA